MLQQVGQALLTMQRYSWEQGVAAQAFLEQGETGTAIMLAREAVQRQGADGRLALMRDNEGVTDPAANGEALLVAARITKDPALQIAADAMLTYLLKAAPRAPDGTIFHVIDAKEVWIDSMYMAPPFLAVAGELDEALRQIQGIKNRLWNSENKLYAHIWDEDRKAPKRAAYWGVGNGWAAAGITRVIRTLPESRAKERQALALHVKDILDGCLAHQRQDGLFHDVLDQPDTFIETNLAQMLAYSIYRGIGGAWLPVNYKDIADKMRSAVHHKVDPSGYVQGVCGAPTLGGQWVQIDPNLHGWWVGGHWVGLLWLAYAATGDPSLTAAARDWANRLLPRQPDQDDHDLGFLFELGFVLGYQLTGDESLKLPALQAAETLSQRFNPRGQFIQAWGLPDASPELRGRTIMDTMMNLDLLFWAGKETGDPRYAAIAAAHARTTLIHHLRPDGSTAHVCDFDPETGAFLKQDTHQGLSATSCWSRGQAWGVYGFADCFRATGDPAFLNTSRRLVEHLWPRLPADLIPFWDFDSPLIPNDVRDSSAASVLASGLLNLASVENDPELAGIWQSRAISILESLWQNYTSRLTGEACLLLHGTRSKPHNLMDHGLIYGDYYFQDLRKTGLDTARWVE